MVDIITGEKIQQLCDIYLGVAEDFKYNPLVSSEKNKQLNLEDINVEYDNPLFIFCYSHRINLLANAIHLFSNKFTLFTGNSDDEIRETEDVLTLLYSNKITKWYAQNICYDHELLHVLPIGLANNMWDKGGVYNTIKLLYNSRFHKTENIYFCFSIGTNVSKRQLCYDSLKNKVKWLNRISQGDNISRLSKYKFSINPDGNGVDCHRLWESLYLNVVPIVLDSVFARNLLKHNVPLVILNSWEDLDITKLNYDAYNFKDETFLSLINLRSYVNLSKRNIAVSLGGGLGNQLFQLSFLLYASQLSNKNECILSDITPRTVHSKNNYYQTIFCKWKSFKKKLVHSVVYTESRNQEYTLWRNILNIDRDVKISGYFQRFEYTEPVYNDFVSKLTFDETILQKYPTISEKFFIHIRGGDYIGNEFHHVDLTNYYKTCIAKHPGEQFIIFTNDINYARNILPDYPIIRESELDTLILMSKCKGCICANSTFSWWGAYLNKNRSIYLPGKWMNDSTIFDSSGLYFPGSIRVIVDDKFPYIDQVVYINLQHRTDRREQIENELSIVASEKLQRFNAIKHDNGRIGCAMSHIAVLDLAIQNNWNNVLILEDDMKWDKKDGFELLKNLALNPYDVIVLGGTYVTYDINTYKLTKTLTTTAYLVHNHYFQTLRDQFSNCLTNNNPIDKEWNLLIKADNWFIVQPNLCVQRTGYSDIEKKHVNYKSYFDNTVLPMKMAKNNFSKKVELENTNREVKQDSIQQLPVKLGKFNFSKKVELENTNTEVKQDSIDQLPVKLGKFNFIKPIEVTNTPSEVKQDVVDELPIEMGKFNLNKRVEIKVNIDPTPIPKSKHAYMTPRKL